MQKNNKRIATRLDVTVCIALACVLLLGAGLLIRYLELTPLYAILACAFLYLFGLYLWAELRRRTESVTSHRRLHEAFAGESEHVLAEFGQPALLCSAEGEIVWCNRALTETLGKRDMLVGNSLDDVCAIDLGEEGTPEDIVILGERLFHYEVVAIKCEEKDAPLYCVVFDDCTDLERLRAVHEAETSVVAYIVMDNMEELLQYVQDTYRSAASAAEAALQTWVDGMGGVLKSYEKDKYIAIFNKAGLKNCIDRRFDVLDSIRSVRVGDGMPVTVSIGVSALGKTLEEKENAAQTALDMALQRGGDQAVVRSESGDEFFGGKTKAVQKRNNVRSRVVANALSSLLARTESVLIMGHRFGDFDSFGSAVGIARFAMLCGVHPRIVINRQDPNLIPCFDMLEGIEDYDDIFVGATEGMDLIRPDTLLIVVDVNNIDHVECPDIMRNVNHLVVIDHHRKTVEFANEPEIVYIEPSASSASELVAEILEQYMASKSLLKEEAELMLAGILLDTKQFTRNTGTRTFSAALYLRGEGAIPGESNDLFRADVSDLTKEAHFHTNVSIYREKIAISYVEGVVDASYRVVAAKAADKLLTVKGVSASVALVTIGDKIHVSARSDGSINVQLILERVGGGGHYDVAGAQVDGTDLQSVITRLRAAIDEYLDK